MSIIGIWAVTINTPMGAQVVSLEFPNERSGIARYGDDSVPLENVSVTGDTATCSVALTQPMRLTLTCSVQVDGDTLTGTARAGFFGTFPLTGQRTK